MKKLISMLLAVALVLGVMAIPVSAAEAETSPKTEDTFEFPSQDASNAPVGWDTLPNGQTCPRFSIGTAIYDWLYETKEGRAWIESMMAPGNSITTRRDVYSYNGENIPNPEAKYYNDLVIPYTFVTKDGKIKIIQTELSIAARNLELGEAIAKALAKAAEAETNPTPTFADVDPDAWYAEAVNAMAKSGLIKGGTDGLFHPDDPVTFAELYTILVRAMGIEKNWTEKFHTNSITEAMAKNPYRTNSIGSSLDYGDRCFYLWRDGKPYHWAAGAYTLMFDRQMGTDLDARALCEPEDVDLPVPRAAALATIYVAMDCMNNETTYEYDMTPIYNYTAKDIPDWDTVMGDRTILTAENGWSAYMQTQAVVYLQGNLNFGYKDNWLSDVSDGKPGYKIGTNKNPTDYNYEVVARNNPQMRPYVVFNPEYVLAAYNIGLTNGVDGNLTCNAAATLTRAELCAMLYRVDIDHVYDFVYDDGSWRDK